MADVGDDGAFVAFLTSHHASLYRTAFLLTGTEHEAEELLQEAVVRLYRRRSLLSRADAPVAYARRALVNTFVSRRRTAAVRTPTAPLSAAVDRPSTGDPCGELDDRSALWLMLLTLPERQRAALVLRYYLDLPETEIATAIGCRPATVRSLVSRGLAALRTQPHPFVTETGDRA
ncbi:SigE family RNA polymerase sigma factor [Lapillicoccus jejuensis]|uniref:RNA polymerase sigma-70 factor (Sigma-E family) n=1 Tax=Lapillicoccus jejuensis TaxID=402171 RepID=A0A542DXX0_9MICO|nr:SigE family RNA polymerase sigma factor [Lapillicoccus jejuensis]TQJ07927.1 RNA polymerase sigma-70 factor (sigma-E family) [Lapillicoccus jejuensis]